MSLRKKLISDEDIKKVMQECEENKKEHENYDLRNAAKFRAVAQSKNYDEFK